MTDYADIRLLVMDVDGVMTDGKITYSSDGQEFKSFNIKDGLGIKRAQASGIETAIITGRTSPMVERRARELGIAHLVQGREDKLSALSDLVDQMNLSLDQVAYIGDDLPDLTAIESVKLGACPADAAIEVKSKASWVSTREGGDGCVRELCDLLVSHKSS
ncbi:MAG: HAD-IIIA family hydrolase [Pseudomonadota bacterium]|nr:HAD-IIIA family hydrolase [Pseudomonadota bacterium]MEC8003444.1 HAD-IIIA family hydrolase [Pseudomonadota bacterium]MEC8167074.1 HAD-IIIA family hydrolase [Pseudomonadota bacterium]MEC8528592.1 HAD-IIIA family hydrolase [Pseudomonadota bacterium]